MHGLMHLLYNTTIHTKCVFKKCFWSKQMEKKSSKMLSFIFRILKISFLLALFLLCASEEHHVKCVVKCIQNKNSACCLCVFKLECNNFNHTKKKTNLVDFFLFFSYKQKQKCCLSFFYCVDFLWIFSKYWLYAQYERGEEKKETFLKSIRKPYKN